MLLCHSLLILCSFFLPFIFLSISSLFSFSCKFFFSLFSFVLFHVFLFLIFYLNVSFSCWLANLFSFPFFFSFLLVSLLSRIHHFFSTNINHCGLVTFTDGYWQIPLSEGNQTIAIFQHIRNSLIKCSVLEY